MFDDLNLTTWINPFATRHAYMRQLFSVYNDTLVAKGLNKLITYTTVLRVF